MLEEEGGGRGGGRGFVGSSSSSFSGGIFGRVGSCSLEGGGGGLLGVVFLFLGVRGEEVFGLGVIVVAVVIVGGGGGGTCLLDGEFAFDKVHCSE